MRYTIPMRRQLLLAAIAALLLAACGGRPAPTPAPGAPTAAAPGAPTTGPGATAAPTASGPTPEGAVLPAPLYILEGGQIARIERDGRRRTVLTAEPAPLPGLEPIAEFAVSPTGTLAYIVNDVEVDRLVLADARGESATARYEQPGHELSDLVFAPDGQSLYLRLLNNREPPDLPSGLYRLPLAGGEPELLRADDEPDDLINPARSVSGYRPIAFSPDGARVLLHVFSLFYEDCGLGVIAADGGEVTRIALPEGVEVFCGEEAWSADGGEVIFLAGPIEGEGAGPRLWSADASSGVATPLLAEGAFARVPLGLPGGAVRFFVADILPGAGGGVQVTFAPAELAGPGAAPTELGQPFDQHLERALWAPDGAGAAIEVSDANNRSLLRWLPADGDPIDLSSADPAAVQLAWGAE